MTRKLVPTLTLACLALVLFALPTALSAGEMEKGHYFTNAKGVFLDGYDVVAYFDDGEAMKGKKKYAAEHDGVTFRFASAEHMKAFQAEPEKYLPEYGGWCAYGVGAAADKFEVDPENYKVVDGKLYLFYNGQKGNTLNLWNEDEKALMMKADSNWQSMEKKAMMHDGEMMDEKGMKDMKDGEMMKEKGMEEKGMEKEGMEKEGMKKKGMGGKG